jgi:hypothetical protein
VARSSLAWGSVAVALGMFLWDLSHFRTKSRYNFWKVYIFFTLNVGYSLNTGK